MDKHNGHMSTAPKPKWKPRTLKTIIAPGAVCEIFERNGQPVFKLQGRERATNEYGLTAVPDLLYICHELADFVIEWDRKHREQAARDA